MGLVVVVVLVMDCLFVYLSCGIWFLMGMEIDYFVIILESLVLNFMNEGGVGGIFCLLKNIMGFWILQESMCEWECQGKGISYVELLK